MVDASLPPLGTTLLLKVLVFPDKLDVSKIILKYNVEMVDASLPPPLGNVAVLKVERFTLIVEFT